MITIPTIICDKILRNHTLLCILTLFVFLDFFWIFFWVLFLLRGTQGLRKPLYPRLLKSPPFFYYPQRKILQGVFVWHDFVAQESTGEGGPTLVGVSAETQTHRQDGVCSALVGFPAPTGRGNLSKGRRSRRARPLAGPLRAEAPHRNTVYPTETPLAPPHSPPGRSSASTHAHPCSTHTARLLPNPTRLHRVAAPPRAPPTSNTRTRIRTHHNTLHHEPIILSYTPTTS